MENTLTRLEICCDPTCVNHNVPQTVELTEQEMQDRAAMVAQVEADRAEQEAVAAAKAEAKASAEAKLAALGLTAEEIAAL